MVQACVPAEAMGILQSVTQAPHGPGVLSLSLDERVCEGPFTCVSVRSFKEGREQGLLPMHDPRTE